MKLINQENANIPIVSLDRINLLLEKNINLPLTILEAGTGYAGKERIQAFLNEHRYKHVWLQLRRVDNSSNAFWKNVCDSMNRVSPKLARESEKLGFPDTVQKIDKFITNCSKHLLSARRVLILVDNYNLIEEKEIQLFFEYIIEMNVQQLTFIVISNKKTNLGLLNLEHNVPIQKLTEQELGFTKDEIQEFFSLLGKDLTDIELDSIYTFTEGWPTAIYLLAEKKQKENLGKNNLTLYLQPLMEVFQKGYFETFPGHIQKLFVKLALGPTFTFDIIAKLIDDDLDKVETLVNEHMFIRFNQDAGAFQFHNMYKQFLLQKIFRITEDEKVKAYTVISDWMLQTEHPVDIAEYLWKSKQYDKLIELGYFEANIYNSAYENRALLEYLNKVPNEAPEENPRLVLLKVLCYTSLLETEKATDLLTKLIKATEQSDTPDSREILGEAYTVLSLIALIKNKEEFVALSKKAAAFLPNGSKVRKKNQVILGYNHIAAISDYEAGALERMEQAYFDANQYLVTILNGGGKGLDYLFSAESGYVTLNLTKAKTRAHETIYHGTRNEQHDIVIAAHVLLLRVAVFQGDYEEIFVQIDRISNYIETHHLSEYTKSLDTVRSWVYLQFDDYESLPDWVKNFTIDSDKSNVNAAQYCILYAAYLILTEEFETAIAVLRHAEKLAADRGLWLDSLTIVIYSAICFLHLEQNEIAVELFSKAYEMSYNNNIISPFIETGKNMRDLIDLAYKDKKHQFDKDWLDDIRKKAMRHAKRLTALKARHNEKKKDIEGSADIYLTKRETQILDQLTQGLTLQEIGQTFDVSVNTVKTHVRNIYNKLGAINRADAVFIATRLGLV